MAIAIKISVAVLRQEVRLLFFLLLMLPMRLFLFQFFLLLLVEVVNADVMAFGVLFVRKILVCFWLLVVTFKWEFLAILFLLFSHLLHIRPFLLALLTFALPLFHFQLQLLLFFLLFQLFTVLSHPKLRLFLHSFISRLIFIHFAVIAFRRDFYFYLNLWFISEVCQS